MVRKTHCAPALEKHPPAIHPHVWWVAFGQHEVFNQSQETDWEPRCLLDWSSRLTARQDLFEDCVVQRCRCEAVGASVAPPTLPECFPTCRCSLAYAGVGFAARSAGLVRGLSFPPSTASSRFSWSRPCLPSSLWFSPWPGFLVVSVFVGFSLFFGSSRFCRFAVNTPFPVPELSSNVLMEPACHFVNLSSSDLSRLFFQVHCGNTSSCWSRYSSGSLSSSGALLRF